jgi:hypothetical protein
MPEKTPQNLTGKKAGTSRQEQREAKRDKSTDRRGLVR